MNKERQRQHVGVEVPKHRTERVKKNGVEARYVGTSVDK